MCLPTTKTGNALADKADTGDKLGSAVELVFMGRPGWGAFLYALSRSEISVGLPVARAGAV